MFTRVLDLPPGEHEYVFLVNGISNMGSSFIEDPYAGASRTGREGARASVITVTAP